MVKPDVVWKTQTKLGMAFQEEFDYVFIFFFFQRTSRIDHCSTKLQMPSRVV